MLWLLKWRDGTCHDDDVQGVPPVSSLSIWLSHSRERRVFYGGKFTEVSVRRADCRSDLFSLQTLGELKLKALILPPEAYQRQSKISPLAASERFTLRGRRGIAVLKPHPNTSVNGASVWSVTRVSSPPSHAVKEKINVLVSLPTSSNQDRELVPILAMADQWKPQIPALPVMAYTT